MKYACVLFVAGLGIHAGCKSDPAGSGTETTTTGMAESTSTSTETTTSTTEPQESSSDDSNGPGCPFYGYEALPPGNLGSPYEWIPDPTDEPKFWFVRYTAEVPGLVFGADITGVPEAEGIFDVMAVIERADGATCMPELLMLEIGPPLPGDSSTSGGSESGTDEGTGTDGSSSGEGSSSSSGG